TTTRMVEAVSQACLLRSSRLRCSSLTSTSGVSLASTASRPCIRRRLRSRRRSRQRRANKVSYGPTMARTHFSVGDVEALIPALERIFTDVLQLRAALRSIEEKLERAGVKMSREELLERDDGCDT